jgi:hypothetical protein
MRLGEFHEVGRTNGIAERSQHAGGQGAGSAGIAPRCALRGIGVKGDEGCRCAQPLASSDGSAILTSTPWHAVRGGGVPVGTARLGPLMKFTKPDDVEYIPQVFEAGDARAFCDMPSEKHGCSAGMCCGTAAKRTLRSEECCGSDV